MTGEPSLSQKVVRVHRALEKAAVPHAFGGAIALAYYATPRATVDIDVNVFVSPRDHRSIEAILSRLGVDRIPRADRVVAHGQMRAWWGRNPVDVFYAYDEIHERMRVALRSVPFGSTEIPILGPEHLLIAKAAFDRAKDWIDIEQMLIAVDDLDLEEVRWGLAHLLGEADARRARVERMLAELR